MRRPQAVLCQMSLWYSGAEEYHLYEDEWKKKFRITKKLHTTTKKLMSRHLKEIWSQVDWVCHLKPGLPECELAAVLHQSQRCVSDGYSWDTGRRSCFAPDREPAGTSATQEIKEEKSWPPVGEMWKGKEILGHCTGTLTFLNISAPLRASNRAMSCGVETITAPGKGTYTEVHKTWGEKKVWPELFWQ